MTVYRLGRLTDVQQLACLRWALRTDDSEQDDPVTKKQFMHDFVAWMIATPLTDLVHWVAEQDDQIIGVVSVRVVPMMPSPENLNDRFGYVTNTYVLPQHRNKGIGTSLLSEVRTWALREKLELLVVWPSDRAYALYERAGYLRYSDPVVLKLRQ